MTLRYLLALVCLAATLATSTGVASAQAAPEFRLGFKALAEQIPIVVGQPLENEHWGANGDSLQQTSNGLMVWRKADNWTAFTDGARTWVNGPLGMQTRGNDERFPWEKDSQAVAAAARPPIRVIPDPTTPTSQQLHTPVVKAMDEESKGPGVMVTAYMRELDAKWATVWGWRPKKPVTVYLYFDGHRMAEGIASVSGLTMTDARKNEIATTIAGMKVRDRNTGGWAVLMNLNKWYGTDKWAIRTKHLLTHEYTHVMQSDAAGGLGPTWFQEGMAELAAFVEVPEATPYLDRSRYVAGSLDRGDLPSLRSLQTGWQEMVKSGGERGQLAYGMSYLAVKYLSDNVGGMPLLQVLERTGRGEQFESALQSVTGYTVDRLDTEYRQIIPASATEP